LYFSKPCNIVKSRVLFLLLLSIAKGSLECSPWRGVAGCSSVY
jgi:hypothetical protein